MTPGGRATASLSAFVILISLASCGDEAPRRSKPAVVYHARAYGHGRGHHAARDARPRQKHRRRTATVTAAGLAVATRSTGCHARGLLPDPACTPGAVSSAATVTRVCTPGYSSRVRDVPQRVKERVYAAYGVAVHSGDTYEVDHLVPLEVGGSNAQANLWPEPSPGFHAKDVLENSFHDQVCAGTLPLALAERRIAKRWTAYASLNPGAPARSRTNARSRPKRTTSSSAAHATCSTFSTHAEAQRYYTQHKGTAAHLDRDGDGQACESLP
jgi:hypothetical protein